MALNLDKSTIEKKYYFEENGVTFGPFPLSVLLTKIKADSFVYRDGIDWAKASEIEELKSYFKVEKITQPEKLPQQNHSNILVDVPKTKSNLGVWIVVSVIILVLIVIVIKNQPKTDSEENTIDSTAMSNILSEFDIFNLNSIQNFKPNEEQKNIATSYLDKGNEELLNRNYTEAINNYKESLRNFPQAITYFKLANAYMKTSDFEGSYQCFRIASALDYQPQSEIDNKILALEAVRGNFELVKNEILSKSYANPKLLSVVEKDSLFYGFRNSPYYLEIIEKNINVDSVADESVYLSIIQNYYEALNNKNMDAHDFFSPMVSQFINKKNTNPTEINELTQSNAEFVDPKSTIIGSRVFETAPNARQAWISFTCFRSSMNKYETCRVKVEFIFDNENKIYSYKELAVKDLIFK
jgi:tetratricopeptide (TPR) repeat protein